MNTESQIYRDLQKHLDRLPIGFPATESGVEIRILEHLFTPGEAKMATQLSMLPEPLKRIHQPLKKTGIPIEELERVLDYMVQKGLILTDKKDGEKRYSNALLAVGMFEFQVNRLTKDFFENMLQYIDEAFGEELYRTKVPQLRTVPVERSIALPHEYPVSTYDDIRQIVANIDGQIAVANCICRQGMDILGESCRVTDLRETCLQFQDTADYSINIGMARPISKEEAFDILKQAQEAGLVLQPENAQQPGYICCCCGDCCGLLTTVKKYPRPAGLYASNYCSEVNPELCTGCEECIDPCQLDALTLVDGVATVNPDRCIGCGNCVVICTFNAIGLRKKEVESLPPKDRDALYTNILFKKVGKWNMLKLGMRRLLKLRV